MSTMAQRIKEKRLEYHLTMEELGEKIIMNRENEGQHLFVLGSGFELLPERLTQVYGERGSVQRAIAHFFASSEARGSCRYAETLDDIPEITHA